MVGVDVVAQGKHAIGCKEVRICDCECWEASPSGQQIREIVSWDCGGRVGEAKRSLASLSSHKSG